MSSLDNIEKIGNIAEFKRGPFGSSIKKSVCVPKAPGRYKLYEQGNVINNDFERDKYYINKEKFEELSHFEIRTGDLLLTCAGTLGKIAIVPKNIQKGIINSVLMRIRINENKVKRNYLYYYFQSPKIQNDISKQSAGVAIKNLFSTKKLKEYTLYLPNKDEQQLIVDEIEKQLTRLEDSIKTFKEVKKKLGVYRKSTFQEAFNGNLTRKWRKENKTIEKINIKKIQEERYNTYCKKCYENKQKPSSIDQWKKRSIILAEYQKIPKLPNTWEYVNISQIFDVYIGATPSRAKKEYWGGKIPWVSSGEVAFCSINTTKEHITPEGYENSSTKKYSPGTVLIGMIGEGKTRGQSAILKIEACNNQNSAAITVSESGQSPEYLYYYLKYVYEKNRRLGSGNNQPALNKKRVQMIEFPIPTKIEQDEIILKIESKFSVINKLEETLNASLLKAESLRKSILKSAFEGKLVECEAA